MATTPPPFPLRVPPTPLHGAKYTHPREGPLPSRKSRRIAHDGKTTPRNRTPSPGPSPSKQPALRQSPRLHAKLESKSSIGVGSLLTPVKTPKKSQTVSTASTSRVLFPNSSAASSKPSTDLIQSRAGAGSDSIQIFEDSNARIPKADLTDDNPFSGKSKPSRKKRKAEVAEEAQPKRNGIWTVFRGRRIFKEFRDEERETIQPRRLFEPEEHQEEEETDIASSPLPCPEDEAGEVQDRPEKAKVGKVTRSRDFDTEDGADNKEPTEDELRQKRVARFAEVDVDVIEPAKQRPSTPEPAGFNGQPMTPPPTVQKKRPHPDAKRPARTAGLATPHRTPKKRKLDEHASLRRAGRRTQL